MSTFQWSNNARVCEDQKLRTKNLKRRVNSVVKLEYSAAGQFFLFRKCRWSAKFVFDLIPHRTDIFLGLAHLGRDHPP